MKPNAVALAGLLGADPPALADEAKFDFRAPAPEPPPQPTVWKANMTAGVNWVDGNAQSIGVSGSGLVGVKHYDNAVELFIQGNYSKVGLLQANGTRQENTAAQFWLGRLRYDRYFLKKNSIYAVFQASGDKPAGYIYRLEPQVGFARILYESKNQLFKGDIGYDYTFERYPIHTVPQDNDFHSARLFLGYENKFTSYGTFTEGFEALWSPAPVIEHVRLNSLTSVSFALYKNVSLKLNFTIKANFDPPPRKPPPDGPGGHFQKVDTILDAVIAVTFI
jgi:hypothetical protein